MQAALSKQAAESQQLVEQLQARSRKASAQLAHDQQEFDALFRGWRVSFPALPHSYARRTLTPSFVTGA